MEFLLHPCNAFAVLNDFVAAHVHVRLNQVYA